MGAFGGLLIPLWLGHLPDFLEILHLSTSPQIKVPLRVQVCRQGELGSTLRCQQCQENRHQDGEHQEQKCSLRQGPPLEASAPGDSPCSEGYPHFFSFHMGNVACVLNNTE